MTSPSSSKRRRTTSGNHPTMSLAHLHFRITDRIYRPTIRPAQTARASNGPRYPMRSEKHANQPRNPAPVVCDRASDFCVASSVFNCRDLGYNADSRGFPWDTRPTVRGQNPELGNVSSDESTDFSPSPPPMRTPGHGPTVRSFRHQHPNADPGHRATVRGSLSPMRTVTPDHAYRTEISTSDRRRAGFEKRKELRTSDFRPEGMAGITAVNHVSISASSAASYQHQALSSPWRRKHPIIVSWGRSRRHCQVLLQALRKAFYSQAQSTAW